jgi:amino acid adenylation domain-containing protein
MKTLEQGALDLKLPKAKPLDALLSELRHLGIQLWVEGDRLRYKAAKDTLTPDLLAQLRDRKVEILEFLQTASLAADPSAATIPVIPRDGNLPLSISQERLWYHHQFEPNSSLNNIITAYRIKGTLDLELLNRAQHEIAQRHEILRTTFPTVDGAPTVAIASEWSLSIPIEDLQSVPVAERDEEAHRRAIAESRRSYDLETGPLFRMRLLQLEPDSYLWVLTMHRMMADGVSVDIVFREIVTRYEAYLLGKPVVLPELPIQYLDFAHWQRQRLQGAFLDRNLRYWKDHLKAPLPTLDFPTSRPRPSTYSFNTQRRRLIFPKRLNDALNALSQQGESTLFMTLMAALKVLLYRYCDQEDVMICCSNAGRNRSEIEHLIGPFFNTLTLRTDLGGNPTFREVIQREKKVALGAFAHQELPFEQLVPELDTSSNRGRSSLFQVFFALNPSWKDGNTLSTVELPGITFDTMFGYLYTGKTKFDLFLVGREAEEGLQFLFEYNSDLFDGELILPIMDHFQTLLESIVTNPDQKISKLSLLTPEEQQQLLFDLNQTQFENPKTECIHHLIEAQVAKNSQAIAIIEKDTQLTYHQLNARANQLAHYLQSQGIKPGHLVALCVERSIEMVIGILGILKAGGAYILFDPAYPYERGASELKAANPQLIVTQSHLLDSFPMNPATMVQLDTDREQIAYCSTENLPVFTTASKLESVIYKSSSTGRANGVCISHSGMVNHSIAIAQSFDIVSTDRVWQFSSIGCDLMLEELFPTLIQGATVVMCPSAIKTSIADCLKFVEQQNITVVNLPNDLWHEWVNNFPTLGKTPPASIRLVVVGGEMGLGASSRTWFDTVGTYPRWLNTYGATETTGTATIYNPAKLANTSSTINSVAIGRPIENVQTYILDGELQPVPIGVAGELHIGGSSLAEGYLNHPELTQQNFIPNPFSNTHKDFLYKTSDRAYYLPDGTIELIGRLDRQIKLDGFRIEPEEIELALLEYPTILKVVVLLQENKPGKRILTAYYVEQIKNTADSHEVRKFLKQKLPSNMIPSELICVESFPLKLNGNIDQLALLDQTKSIQATKGIYVASQNTIEQNLIEIWEEVFDLRPIGTQNNFFDLGGHSLLAVRLFSKIEKCFNRNLPLSALLQAPTIEQLANLLKQEESKMDCSPLVKIQDGDEKPPLFCIHGGGFNILIYRDLALNIGSNQPVYGLQARGLREGESIADCLEEIATDYVQEIRKIQPHGPYYLVGLSNGGNIALEMAQQLQIQGEEVALLGMFDTYGPQGISLFPRSLRFLSSLNYLARHSLPRAVSRHWKGEKKITPTNILNLISQNKKQDLPSTEIDAENISHPSSIPNKHWMDKFSQYVLEHSPWSFFSPKNQLKGIEGSVSERLKKLEEMYEKVYTEYEMKPYSGKIILFRAQECPPGYRRKFDLGWSAIATKGVNVYEIPGHHTSLMRSPILAEKLKIHLKD